MKFESILGAVPAAVIVALASVLVYVTMNAVRCLVARLQNNPCPS